MKNEQQIEQYFEEIKKIADTISREDIDRAIDHYIKLCFGPFKVFEAKVTGFIYKDKEVYA